MMCKCGHAEAWHWWQTDPENTGCTYSVTSGGCHCVAFEEVQ